MDDRALIDTDILSYFFRGHEPVVENFRQYSKRFDIIEISIITYYEILSGLLAKSAFKQLRVFENFVEGSIVIPVTIESAKISSELYSKLRKTGKIIDDIDLLIAGIAIENSLTLITNNETHFNRIEGLKIKNWSK